MNFKNVFINAMDIQDAWHQCINSILENGRKYKIQQGSYVGQTRLQFDNITIYIKNPYMEPYDLMLPQIPPHFNIPNPVENGYVEQYLPYLITGEIKKGESYTYGSRLNEMLYVTPLGQKIKWTEEGQINYFIRLLRKTPNTNQAILQVAQPSDCLLDDSPCLRHIDIRIENNQLIFYPYFRSWDLWGGMPANLAGIAVLQKYMSDEIGVESGPICASSKGLHIYGYVEKLAKLRVGK